MGVGIKSNQKMLANKIKKKLFVLKTFSPRKLELKKMSKNFRCNVFFFFEGGAFRIDNHVTLNAIIVMMLFHFEVALLDLDVVMWSSIVDLTVDQ